jgi:UvrD-like helicase C-terminal domain
MKSPVASGSAFADTDLTVSAAKLGTGGFDHGYALTIHQAQGLTVDTAFVLGSASLYREAAYVGLSRGRRGNQVYLADQVDDFAYTDDTIDRPTQPSPDRPDAMTATTAQWQRSRAQHTAIDMR